MPSAVNPDPVSRNRSSRYPNPPTVAIPPMRVEVIAQPIPMPDHASLLRDPLIGGGHSNRLLHVASNRGITRFRWSEAVSGTCVDELVKGFTWTGTSIRRSHPSRGARIDGSDARSGLRRRARRGRGGLGCPAGVRGPCLVALPVRIPVAPTLQETGQRRHEEEHDR